jgi:hypothetical protein
VSDPRTLRPSLYRWLLDWALCGSIGPRLYQRWAFKVATCVNRFMEVGVIRQPLAKVAYF